MYEATPKSLKKTGKYLLSSEWSDGFKSVIKLSDFREECPCAHCMTEREEKAKKAKKDAFAMPMMKTFHEGMNTLVSLKPVGNYAVRPAWGDGHEEGLYDWGYLRKVFEKRKLSDEEVEKIKEKE